MYVFLAYAFAIFLFFVVDHPYFYGFGSHQLPVLSERSMVKH